MTEVYTENENPQVPTYQHGMTKFSKPLSRRPLARIWRPPYRQPAPARASHEGARQQEALHDDELDGKGRRTTPHSTRPTDASITKSTAESTSRKPPSVRTKCAAAHWSGAMTTNSMSTSTTSRFRHEAAAHHSAIVATGIRMQTSNSVHTQHATKASQKRS